VPGHCSSLPPLPFVMISIALGNMSAVICFEYHLIVEYGILMFLSLPSKFEKKHTALLPKYIRP
jgi:hypothetical protein